MLGNNCTAGTMCRHCLKSKRTSDIISLFDFFLPVCLNFISYRFLSFCLETCFSSFPVFQFCFFTHYSHRSLQDSEALLPCYSTPIPSQIQFPFRTRQLLPEAHRGEMSGHSQAATFVVFREACSDPPTMSPTDNNLS